MGASPAVKPAVLLDKHRELIEGSAISEECAKARGYWSAEQKSKVRELGFSPAQTLVPALVVPLYNVRGEQVSYQLRPDRPRIKNGKALKYETPARSGLIIDVPPLIQPKLRTMDGPLIITEGSRKADSAASRGLTTIALLGVWGWRGKNDEGGITALSDWDYIHLKGRKVIIAFDSDVMQKREVWKSMIRLKKFLEGRGADVWIIYLPEGEDGSKTGLDDFFAAGSTADALLMMATKELREPPRREGIRTASDYVKDAPLPELVIPDRYFLRDDATGMVKPVTDLGGELDAILAHSPILITGRLRDVNDGTESLILSWKRSGRWDSVMTSRGVAMESRKLIELAERGFPVASDNAKDLVSFFRSMEAANEEGLPTACVSRWSGWQSPGDGEGVLWGDQIITID